MFNKLSVAVAAALFSASAFALPPTTTPNVEVWMSGASAQDPGIARLFDDICMAGTLHTYKDGVTATGISHQAYFCEVDINQVSDGDIVPNGAMSQYVSLNPDTDLATPGYQGNMPDVLFHKRSAGGSAQGVNPILDGTPITHMVINNTSINPAGNCVITSGTTYGCTITNAGDTFNVPAGINPATNAPYARAGTSDVNPQMFVGQNTPSGSLPVDSNLVSSRLTVEPGAALLFGIPVSEPLYRALQWAQFPAPTPGGVPVCVGSDTEACMPTLSKAEVASIMAGKVPNWNVFKAGPTLAQGFRDYVVAKGGTAPSSNLVQICRRTNGSGTQAQMSAKFLNYPCTPGAGAPASTGSPALGPVINLGSSAGSVDTCLSGHATGNRWAIGLQSLDKNPLVNGVYPLAYRFVKIDGYAPTLANAANGKYFDWVENTYQWRKDAGTALANDVLDIIYTVANNAGKMSIVRDVLNPPLMFGFGQSGYLALDTAGTNTPVFPFVNTNPVMPYTHTFGGGGTDNCRSPVLFSAAGM